MIAAVKVWHAGLTALLTFFPLVAPGAEDPSAAARELALKAVAYAGPGEPVSVSWRNVSSLGSPELAQARRAFEAAVRESGGRISEIAPVAEARISLSENPTQYLLIAEVRKGEERQVWMAAWKRGPPSNASLPGIALEKRLLWEQSEPILDVAVGTDRLLVLSPSKLSWLARDGNGWKVERAIEVPAARPWPRDARGRLRVLSGDVFQAYLPGRVCRGSEASGSLDCQAGEEPWTLESGSRFLLLAYFAGGRNYFDGRVTTQSGQRKSVAPFYSAAAVEDPSGPQWLLAMVDGTTQYFDAAWEPIATVGDWGSDIVGIDARCGGGSAILATKPTGTEGSDAVQAFAIVNRAAVPMGRGLEFEGPITALWPSGGGSAVAVFRDSESGRFSAYLVSVVCGP
jgi:hypothetical protein